MLKKACKVANEGWNGDSMIGSIALMKSYNNVLKRGCRIALRAKVNDSLISGLSVVDSILPVGRGQRQLMLGDRYTGKTSIFLSLLGLISQSLVYYLVIDWLLLGSLWST